MFMLAEYRIRTSNADWQGICSLNGVEYDSFWTKSEFSLLSKVIKSGECVLGFTAGTIQLSAEGKISSFGKDSWLVVLSSERIILVNASKSSPIIKNIAISKVSGMVASQNKALGQLVIVLDNGIVTIENAMVNTTRSMEYVFRQLRECEKDRGRNTASKIAPRKVETKESELQENKANPRNENKSEKVTKPYVPKQIANPFAEEIENEELENDGKISVTKASIVALLFGRIGIHDFIWGKTVFGLVKLILVFTLFIAMRKDLYVFSSLIVLVLGIWVTVDILNMFAKKFFGNKPCMEINAVFRSVIIAVCVIDLLICCANLFSDIRDSRLKDYGGHVYWNEIVDAYKNKSIMDRKRFENRRFSIIAQVSSVKKNMFGEYEVKLDGLSLLPANYQNEIKSMELTFSHQQAESIEKMQKGNMFAASCIGRGVSLGSYTADKCILKHVRQYR